MLHLWGWTLTCRGSSTNTPSNPSQDLQFTTVAQNITLLQNEDPTKLVRRDSYLSRLLQMLGGFKKDDPTTVKKMSCTIDLSEKMASWGLTEEATELNRGSVGSWLYSHMLPTVH